MKNVSLISSGLVLMCLPVFLLLLSCNISKDSAQSTTSKERDPNLIVPGPNDASPQSWDALFRRVAGVQVSGSYPNLSLRIRGANSLNLTTEPLFVLEGVPLGHQFINLDRAATPQDVASIQVLKGPDATIYGARGSNGVIVVTLKN